MFSKKDHKVFVASLILLVVGLGSMALDPEPNGFGMLTLGIAPPLLLVAFCLPCIGIVGVDKMVNYSLQVSRARTVKYLFGGFVFLVSILTYIATLEPTASLWDCSEFIASAYKLEVPHTPGTPLSLLVAKIFTVLSFGDNTQVAWSINVMSAFFSALTVALVYFLIYHLAENAYPDPGNHTALYLISASCCGSLCLAFSDTFWFSAVEAETYGIACFFLLLLVYLIVTAKGLSTQDRARRLVLIFYVAGLSYCIHPMCLLALTLLPFAWRDKMVTVKHGISCLLIGLLLVLAINRGVAVGLFELAFTLDLSLVNGLNLPFYSGAIVLAIALVCSFAFLLKKFPGFASYPWATAFLILGFTPYVMLFIRSGHNPPIDEANPENLAMIKAYMNRENYPSQPLVYGPYFDAKIEAVTEGKKMYFKDADQYKESGTSSKYHYEKTRSTLLPRMYSNDADHIRSYRRWTDLQDHEKPRFTHNIQFMITYQLGHMYLRYLLWNFAGREDDHQNSRWLTPWDGLKAGQPADITRNQYWMLPLLLGITGVFYQSRKHKKDFVCVSIFFLTTGLVLALYLNSTPNEPRERDYIYIGSYIAWCVWIGLGIIALYKLKPTARLCMVVVTLISVAVPGWMLYQNYDDHDRSGRTFQIDHARNMLNSCAPNAIFFTGGDNDTFPLWYLQEVEGFRTDVRVVVLSYFNTDWYINQLRKPYYQSAAFKLTLDQNNYRQYGLNDVLYLQETFKEGIDVQKFLQLLKTEHQGLTVSTASGEKYNIVPSKILKYKVASDTLPKNPSMVTASVPGNTAHELIINIEENYLQKNALAFLDILVSNGWDRPIYLNFTSLNTLGLDIRRHVIQEGSLYRVSPIENDEGEILVDTGLSRKNLLEKAKYENLLDSSIYFNYEDYQARMITPVRESFNTLAAAYMNEGNNNSAEEVLMHAVKFLYPKHLPPAFTNLHASEMLAALGKKQAASQLSISLFDYQYSRVSAHLNDGQKVDRLDLYLADQAAAILSRMGHPQFADKMDALAAYFKTAYPGTD